MLRNIGAQVKTRIPGEFGFAVLLFPVGEHAHGNIRYVGDCARADVLDMMATWVALQRGQTLPSATADAFTSTPPTEPGFYVLKTDHPAFEDCPELVKLVDADGHLQIHHYNGEGFEPSADFVKDLDPVCHIWLGPIPEPWKGWDGKSEKDRLLEDVAVDGGAAALHHADAFSKILADYGQQVRAKTNAPKEPLPPVVLGLIQDALGHGYAQGIVQQMNNPYRVPVQ